MERSIKTVLAAVPVALALACSATPAAAQETREQPIQPTTRPNRFLLIGGSAIVAASYIPAVAVAASSEREGDKWLYVPVLGPWADLVDREGCAGDCETEALNKTLLIGAGVAHIVGVGAIVSSFFIPEENTRVKLREDTAKPKVHITPVSMGRGGSGAGLSVVGTF